MCRPFGTADPLKNNFLPGWKFEDLSDLNRQALDWCRSADKKPHEGLAELTTLAFAARAENVVLLGPPGIDKTHQAVGIAMTALKFGLDTCSSIIRKPRPCSGLFWNDTNTGTLC